MRIIDFGRSSARIELTAKELMLVNNAINEVCNGIDLGHDGEFSTRLGVNRDEALGLLHEVGDLISRAQALVRSIPDERSGPRHATVEESPRPGVSGVPGQSTPFVNRGQSDG
jgi:hypothetical protein